MDEFKIKNLKEKIQRILERHKDKPVLYKKMKKFSRRLIYSPYVNPKVYKKLAKLTSEINFECGFKDGKCKAKETEMCCCIQCREYYGHFHIRFFDDYSSEIDIEKELLYYAKKIDDRYGFWRRDKGCILPRERRSATCLTYNCIRDKLSTEEKLLLNTIANSRYTMPSYLPLIIKLLKDYFLNRKKCIKKEIE